MNFKLFKSEPQINYESLINIHMNELRSLNENDVHNKSTYQLICIFT
jgi:hypothetical protein